MKKCMCTKTINQRIDNFLLLNIAVYPYVKVWLIYAEEVYKSLCGLRDISCRIHRIVEVLCWFKYLIV